jgi:inorganic pyrophosphatase
MSSNASNAAWEVLRVFFKPHPWHGIPIGDSAPKRVTSYIEIVPTDTVKYELEKTTGYLKVDRPQKYSNVCPTPYGFIPQTYCGEKVSELTSTRTGSRLLRGDGDPLDICVLTDRTLSHADLVLDAIPIGGLRMLDGGEADDKIVAVLEKDATYGHFKDIGECPRSVVDRLVHYFLTYKLAPGSGESEAEITHVYGHEEAYDVIRRSHEDYAVRFRGLMDLFEATVGSH